MKEVTYFVTKINNALRQKNVITTAVLLFPPEIIQEPLVCTN